MSTDFRPSPRAAIRNWLEQSDKPAETTTPPLHRTHSAKDISTRLDKYTADTKDYTSNPRLTGVDDKLLHGKRKHRDRRTTAAGIKLSSSWQRQANRCVEEHRNGIRDASADDRGLAERLNLHAPFRAFAGREPKQQFEEHNLGDKKRRRYDFSSSPLLQPAELLETESSRRGLSDDEALAKSHKRKRILLDQSSQASESLVVVESLHKEPTKSYERRPRHKTKNDKYELKQDGKRPSKRKKKSEESTTNVPKKGKKRKRKERSGDALMHNFSAPNVAQNRITVRTSEARVSGMN